MSYLADSILVLLAIVLPPAVAWIKTGRKDLALNIIATVFVWFPGILRKLFLWPCSNSPRIRTLTLIDV